MNHRTPAEDFRARIDALNREQLVQAMHYLRGYDPDAVNRALEVVSVPVTTVIVTGAKLTDAELARELAHIALEGTL